MKMYRRLFAAAWPALLLAATVAAQPPPAPPPERGEGAAEHRRRHRPVERLMDWLEHEKPARHGELEDLRENDREAFRIQIRAMLQEKREERFGAGRGRFSPDDSCEHRRLRGKGRRDDVQGRPDGREQDPQVARLEEKVRKLVFEYQDVEAKEKRAKIKAQLQQLLEELFDLREDRRRAIIANMEAKVERMQEIMEERISRRDEIINKRLQCLLNPPPGR